VKLQEELKDSGFIIVAAHSQDVPEDQVVKLVRSQKVNYVITNGARVPGDNGNTIPRAFLFDASGNLAGTGHPESLKQRIKDLVKSEPHFLAAGRKYTKLASVAESLKHTKAFGQVLKKIEKDLKGEGEAAEEAKYLTERIQGYGKKKLAEAKASETDDPFASQQLYTDLAAQWKGDAIGDQASARLKELKADKEFQTELAASQVYHQILAECDKLVFQGGKIDHEYGPNKKVSASVKGMVAQFKKKFSNSKSAAKIDKDLEAYNFKSL
jgi:hypothetical protein